MRNSPLGVAGSGISARAHQVRAQSQFRSFSAKTFFRTTDLERAAGKACFDTGCMRIGVLLARREKGG